MSSPVLQCILGFISLDRSSSTPLFVQLSQQLVNGIQRGLLVIGAKLPGSRQLSVALDLHRKTVIAAYNELDAQGWIEIIPNKGSFILQKDKIKLLAIPKSTPLSTAQYPTSTGFEIPISNFLDNPFEENVFPHFFSDGCTDIRLAQVKNLSLHYSASMNRKGSLKRMTQYQEHGNIYFKEQLSNFLNLSRGLHIAKTNLLITRSADMSLYLIAKVLIGANDKVVVAELSNFSANMTLQQAGAQLITIPIDDKGICIDALRERLTKNKIRMVYITPHHHYPTTVTLSAERRIELLQLANQHGFIIVEDDYDYDFHYDRTAVLPLASADLNGMVIYTGTFGQSLAPAFRTGFIVAPANLIQEMNKHRAIMDRSGDIIMEQALAEMIDDGVINRHLKKSSKIYKSRRDAMCNLLEEIKNDTFSFATPSGGLAVWLKFNKAIPLITLRNKSMERDLFIPRHILYQNKNLCAIRLGFGHLNDEEMIHQVSILKSVMDSLIK